MRSYLDLPCNLQVDTAAYYVDRLKNQSVPGYLRLDVRLGWHPTRNLDFSVGVHNLMDNRHPEFGTSVGAQSTQVQRSIYGKISWSF